MFTEPKRPSPSYRRIFSSDDETPLYEACQVGQKINIPGKEKNVGKSFAPPFLTLLYQLLSVVCWSTVYTIQY